MADSLNGVIINADASQVYADLRILSARPDAADEARAPHRLFGVLDGAEICTAARWVDMAKAEIAAAHADGRAPILVGGTGLYLQSLLWGLAPVPDIADDVRAEIRNLDRAEVRAALEVEDPAMAARLHANDWQRNARALEVWRATGQSLLFWQQQPRSGGLADTVDLQPLLLLPDRAVLNARIDQRIEQMWQAGALDEVCALWKRQLPPDCPVMRAIGVPPLLALLQGQLDEVAAIQRWRLDTRRYAKRQSTWFRHQTPDWPILDQSGQT